LDQVIGVLHDVECSPRGLDPWPRHPDKVWRDVLSESPVGKFERLSERIAHGGQKAERVGVWAVLLRQVRRRMRES
jgi:hypothetical protein